MKLKRKEGHLIYQPLDKLFNVVEKFGSLSQTYDALTGDYLVDRTLTPMVLQPVLSLSDPDGILPDGDYTSQLVNCVWTVTGQVRGESPQQGTHYTIDDRTHAMTIAFNLDPDTSGSITFSADFVDPRRSDVLKCYWKGDLSCLSSTNWKVTIHTEWPIRTDLFPWKQRGIFSIPVQLRNGARDLPDADCVYRWQVFENNVWRNIDLDVDYWCRGGEQTKRLSAEQNYIQTVLLRCIAWPVGNSSEMQATAFKLRRFYGFYDDDVEILEGAYVFPETARAVAEAYVVKRSGGLVINLENYFDIEILYNRGDGSWWHVAHGTRGEVSRAMFPVDSAMVPVFAELTRELSALQPFTLDGDILTIDGEELFGQFPTIERDFEE